MFDKCLIGFTWGLVIWCGAMVVGSLVWFIIKAILGVILL